MLTKSPHPESDPTCGHPACCLHETAATAAAHPHQAEPLPKKLETGNTAALKRWFLWFLTFFGIYASSSMCPFCGTPGCPVGAGGAALVGGAFAACGNTAGISGGVSKGW
jgi:hypothetical protein